MPTIVNQSFFVEDIFIPNLTHTSDINRVMSFVNKYEPNCLIKIMGYPLYRLFQSENTQRMTDLLNGVEYEDSEGNIQRWQGLVHDTNVSLIASYVYFYFEESKKAQSTGTGTSTQKPEAGIASSPADKMAKAWNFFSHEVYDMTHFLWLQKDINGERVYPEFTYYQFFETRRIARTIDSVFSF